MIWSGFQIGIFITVVVLLLLACQLSGGAFWIPFYQQLSSENSSLLPTWSSSWWGSKSSNQGWKFHQWGWIWRVCSSTPGTEMKFKSHWQTRAHKSCLHCLDMSNLTLKLSSLDACQRRETLCKHFLINTVSIPYSNQWVPQAKTTD